MRCPMRTSRRSAPAARVSTCAAPAPPAAPPARRSGAATPATPARAIDQPTRRARAARAPAAWRHAPAGPARCPSAARRPGHRPGGGPRPRCGPRPPWPGQPANCCGGQPGARPGPRRAPRARRAAAGGAPARRSAPRRDGRRRHGSAPEPMDANGWRWSRDGCRQVQAVELVHGRLHAVAQPRLHCVGGSSDRFGGEFALPGLKVASTWSTVTRELPGVRCRPAAG